MKGVLSILTLGFFLLSSAVLVRAQERQPYCASGDTTPNVLTEQEVRDGWRLLFDGETFAGWHRFGHQPVGSAWTVDGGAIRLVPGDVDDWQLLYGGDILTDAVFEDFDLRLEWKVAEGGNSGIFYMVEEAEESVDAPSSGPEMQVLDSQRHPDGRSDKHRAGDLYDLIGTPFRAECAVGQWNRARILKDGPHVQHWLNGRLLFSFELWTEEWDRMVAASKFAEWPGFGQSRRGRIGLQDHGDPVWYRNIAIREGRREK